MVNRIQIITFRTTAILMGTLLTMGRTITPTIILLLPGTSLPGIIRPYSDPYVYARPYSDSAGPQVSDYVGY